MQFEFTLIILGPIERHPQFMGFLKGNSSLMIYEKWGNWKYKYRNREFWCRGYYVDTAGKDVKNIKGYIQKQLKEDQLGEQLTLSIYLFNQILVIISIEEI